MKFCIIGDSWAGNIKYNFGVFDNIFKQHGHTIENLSTGGASNAGQLRILEYDFLEQHKTADYILWIYTEPARSVTEFITLDYGDDKCAAQNLYPKFTYKNFYQDLQYVARQDFNTAQRLFDTYNIPFVVIGGAGVVDSRINDYSFLKWVLPSWNKEISKLDKMPINCYPHHVVKMCRYNYNKKEVMEELDAINSLEIIMKDKHRYPDNCHPSVNLYPELVDRILQNLN